MGKECPGVRTLPPPPPAFPAKFYFGEFKKWVKLANLCGKLSEKNFLYYAFKFPGSVLELLKCFILLYNEHSKYLKMKD